MYHVQDVANRPYKKGSELHFEAIEASIVIKRRAHASEAPRLVSLGA